MYNDLFSFYLFNINLFILIEGFSWPCIIVFYSSLILHHRKNGGGGILASRDEVTLCDRVSASGGEGATLQLL